MEAFFDRWKVGFRPRRYQVFVGNGKLFIVRLSGWFSVHLELGQRGADPHHQFGPFLRALLFIPPSDLFEQGGNRERIGAAAAVEHPNRRSHHELRWLLVRRPLPGALSVGRRDGDRPAGRDHRPPKPPLRPGSTFPRFTSVVGDAVPSGFRGDESVVLFESGQSAAFGFRGGEREFLPLGFAREMSSLPAGRRARGRDPLRLLLAGAFPAVNRGERQFPPRVGHRRDRRIPAGAEEPVRTRGGRVADRVLRFPRCGFAGREFRRFGAKRAFRGGGPGVSHLPRAPRPAERGVVPGSRGEATKTAGSPGVH